MNPMLNLWLIPILPLAGAAINGFFGKEVFAAGRDHDRSVVQRRGVCDGIVGRAALLFAAASLP